MTERDAKSAIMQRVRSALAREARPPVAAAPEESPAPASPAPPEQALVDLFRQRCEEAGGNVHDCGTRERAGRWLGDRITSRGLTRLALSDSPTARDVASVARSTAQDACELVGPDAPRAEVFLGDVGLCEAQAAIAETGSLVLDSAAERHRLTSLVPTTHVALLKRSAILADLDALFHGLARRTAGLPRCLTLITGPSRTADIELELVVGVHGPRELHVLMLDD